MIRVVLDTNVLVSALLKPESVPATVLMLALSGGFQLCVSEAIFAEYEEVIRRPRFKRSPNVIDGTLRSIRKIGYWVKPATSVKECGDPADNMFLECAEAANADYLVTGNERHFPDRWKKTAVINARDLIELIINSS